MAEKKVHSILLWEDVHPNVFEFGEVSDRIRPDGLKSDKVYLLSMLAIDRGDLDELFPTKRVKEIVAMADAGEIPTKGDLVFLPMIFLVSDVEEALERTARNPEDTFKMTWSTKMYAGLSD